MAIKLRAISLVLVIIFFQGIAVQCKHKRPLNPENEHTKQLLTRWHSEQTKWFQRVGPDYALKLFQSIGYDPKLENQVFSPLSLKLSLLALASVSDAQQEEAINKFLFDQQTEHSMLSQRMDHGEYPLRESKEHEASKPCLYFPWLDPAVYGDVVRHQRVLDDIPHSHTELSHKLNRHQKLKLCYAFGISDTEECLIDFINDPVDFCDHNQTIQYLGRHHDERQNWTNADIGWQLAREFSDTYDEVLPSIFHSYLHRISFINNTELHFKSPESKKLWEHMLTWFHMKNFDLATEAEQFRQFEMDQLSDHVLTLNPPLGLNEFLSIVVFDQRLNQSFSRLEGKWNFYGHNLDDATSPHQVENLVKHDYFGRLTHTVNNKSHTLLRIPYQDPKYSLVILLPDQKSNIPEMLSSLTGGQLDYYFKRFLADDHEGSKIVLTIPRISFDGQYDFGPMLAANQINEFNLTRISPEVSIPANRFRQLIRVTNYGIEEAETNTILSLEPRYAHEPADASIDDFVPVNRPFAYMVVGKYIDLHRKPGFEIILSGYYNGPVGLKQTQTQT